MVNRTKTYYNLDAIISVGFRVNTRKGIEFRRWANGILKDYILKGYAINLRLAQIEERADARFNSQDARIAALENKVDFFVRSSLPPVEGIFYDGQIIDAYVQIVNLIKQAHNSIVLVDNYIDASTLTMLSNRATNVSATIYGRNGKNGYRFDGGLSICGRKMRPQKEIIIITHNQEQTS